MKTQAVALILDTKPEEALALMSRWYKVPRPRLGVGVFEGKTKGVAAVYSMQRKEILAAKREFLYDPFVIVHEFYHHLRSTTGQHRGTEKQADKFASGFIEAYNRAAGNPEYWDRAEPSHNISDSIQQTFRWMSGSI